jgi:hypothetical protein
MSSFRFTESDYPFDIFWIFLAIRFLLKIFELFDFEDIMTCK